VVAWPMFMLSLLPLLLVVLPPMSLLSLKPLLLVVSWRAYLAMTAIQTDQLIMIKIWMISGMMMIRIIGVQI